MADTDNKIYEKIGELLAGGSTNSEIVAAIQEITGNHDEAVTYLRKVYDNWQDVVEALDLHKADYANWHIHLRMKLLQGALTDETTQGQTLSLRILDSLAQIQDVGGASPALAIPLPIELVPKGEKSE